MALQIVLGGVDEALLLARRDAGGRAAVRVVGPGAHLDEDEGAVAVAQDQVDLAGMPAGAGGDSIIPLQKAQAGALRVDERGILGRRAACARVAP